MDCSDRPGDGNTTKTMNDPAVINGKRYSLWPQFVEKKAQYIGGILEDVNDGPEPAQTEITDIRFEANGDTSAAFHVDGKEFGCGCDVQHLVVDPQHGGDGWIAFSGYGGHLWRIKARDDSTALAA